MSSMQLLMQSPIPVSELESVLAWIDTFKLSRQCKKINRDFSDAVLLAEILSVHYPKLVEMHNYPPRNSHALKLNNWMTLNRKVLKKLKLNLCCNTMEQLANCVPGVIERVCVMVRDKIHRDEEASKRDMEQQMSSGGSYYEACGEEDHVLVVPVKTRVNGVLETIQQKVVSHDTFVNLQEDLKDAKETTEVLKQKISHLDSLLKLKDERIEELQKQLERKQTRRKEAEAFQNSLCVPFEEPPSPRITENIMIPPTKNVLLKSTESIKVKTESQSKIPMPKTVSMTKAIPSDKNMAKAFTVDVMKGNVEPNTKSLLVDAPAKVNSANNIVSNAALAEPVLNKSASKTSIIEVQLLQADVKCNIPSFKVEVEQDMDIDKERSHDEDIQRDGSIENIDRVHSDVFKEVEIIRSNTGYDMEEFKDSVEDIVVTIEDSIAKELMDLTGNLVEFKEDRNNNLNRPQNLCGLISLHEN